MNSSRYARTMRIPCSAAPASRRPVVIHGKERPPVPKLIKVMPGNGRTSKPPPSASAPYYHQLKQYQHYHQQPPKSVIPTKLNPVQRRESTQKPKSTSTHRYFSEEISDSTDITDVTAKSHNSTSVSAQINNDQQHVLNNSNASYFQQRKHQNNIHQTPNITTTATNTNTTTNQLRPRPESVFSHLIKNSLAKNHIKIQYGPVTSAESINHLEAYKIDFLKQTAYLADLRLLYPKISINLSESLKRIYIFGALGQVTECKQKLKEDLAKIKKKEFRLENKEVATYLFAKEIKEKVLRHTTNHFLKKNQRLSTSMYGHLNNSAEVVTNTANLDSSAKKYFFVNYEVFDHSSKSVKDLGEYSLVVYTNYEKAYEYVFNYLSESIYVDYELKIKSDEFGNFVASNDPRWAEFYNKTLGGCFVVYRLDCRKSKKKSRQMRWYLKLTGYKGYCEEFLSKLVENFGNVFD